jgi:HKD family nuclease
MNADTETRTPKVVRPEWKHLEAIIRQATTELVLAVPYITPKALRQVARQLRENAEESAKLKVRLYIDWSRCLSVSDPVELADALEELRRAVKDVIAYRFDGLHAKVYLAKGGTGLLGSANLTQQAFTSNFELAVVMDKELTEQTRNELAKHTGTSKDEMQLDDWLKRLKSPEAQAAGRDAMATRSSSDNADWLKGTPNLKAPALRVPWPSSSGGPGSSVGEDNIIERAIAHLKQVAKEANETSWIRDYKRERADETCAVGRKVKAIDYRYEFKLDGRDEPFFARGASRQQAPGDDPLFVFDIDHTDYRRWRESQKSSDAHMEKGLDGLLFIPADLDSKLRTVATGAHVPPVLLLDFDLLEIQLKPQRKSLKKFFKKSSETNSPSGLYVGLYCAHETGTAKLCIGSHREVKTPRGAQQLDVIISNGLMRLAKPKRT